jgi:methylmalonyl-CoA mutase C-terminal domain/subunit
MGMRVSAAEVASAAIDEDVDVIGVSNHSASLVVLCEDIRSAMASAGATDIPIVAGGTVLHEDVEALREMGVEAVFGPGADTDAIIVAIRKAAARREST